MCAETKRNNQKSGFDKKSICTLYRSPNMVKGNIFKDRLRVKSLKE